MKESSIFVIYDELFIKYMNISYSSQISKVSMSLLLSVNFSPQSCDEINCLGISSFVSHKLSQSPPNSNS